MMGKWFTGIIAAVIAGLVVWYLTEGYLSQRGERQGGDKGLEDNRPVKPQIRPDDVPHDIQPNPADNQPMGLQIRPAAVPHDLRPNTVYDVSIMVLSEKELPVVNALVEINVGGGSFLDTGNFTTMGNTDMRGVFRTQWRSLDHIPNGYQFGIRVRKDELTARGEMMLSHFGE